MGRFPFTSTTSALALACGLFVQAAVEAAVDRVFAVPIESARNIPKTRILPAATGLSTLRISNVRLESAPGDAPKPSAVLKFDMLNEGDLRVTDIVIQIALLEKLSAGHALHAARVVVGPFTIRGHATIEAGYTVNYEMLLRNLSSDCACVASVVVVSARPLSDLPS